MTTGDGVRERSKDESPSSNTLTHTTRSDSPAQLSTTCVAHDASTLVAARRNSTSRDDNGNSAARDTSVHSEVAPEHNEFVRRPVKEKQQ